MSDQKFGPDYFIEIVTKMRKAQRDYFEHRDAKSYRESLQLEKLVDTWIQAHKMDREKLQRLTGQKVN